MKYSKIDSVERFCIEMENSGVISPAFVHGLVLMEKINRQFGWERLNYIFQLAQAERVLA